MPLRDLPIEVQRLIDSLSSTDQLEVLLHLRRSPSRVSEADVLAGEIGLSIPVVKQTLRELIDRRLVTSMTVENNQTGYQYAPATVQLHAAVEGLGIAITTHSVAIIKALQDQRNRALRNFADAFRIRRKPSP